MRKKSSRLFDMGSKAAKVELTTKVLKGLLFEMLKTDKEVSE